jgi:hypothetical protein
MLLVILSILFDEILMCSNGVQARDVVTRSGKYTAVSTCKYETSISRLCSFGAAT